MQYAVSDYLSQLESSESSNGVYDEFLDVELFKITVEAAIDESVAGEDKWMMDMHQFLNTRIPLKELN